MELLQNPATHFIDELRRFNIIIFGRRLGITLTELLIVVVIIGILFGITLPILIETLEKSKVHEGVSNLRLLYTSQELYFLENRQYAQDIDLLSIENPNDAVDRYFSYSIDMADAVNFTAKADRINVGPRYNYNYFIDKSGDITSDGPFYPDP